MKWYGLSVTMFDLRRDREGARMMMILRYKESCGIIPEGRRFEETVMDKIDNVGCSTYLPCLLTYRLLEHKYIGI